MGRKLVPLGRNGEERNMLKDNKTIIKLKGTSQDYDDGDKLVPLRAFNKILNN